MPRAVTLGCFLLLCFYAQRAEAHVRPYGSRLLWRQAAADALPIVVTNRGIVFESSRAESRYDLRCNDAYGVATGTAPHALLDDTGAIVIVATPHVIARSADRACTVSQGAGLPSALGAASEVMLGGFAQDPSAPSRVLLSTLTYREPAQVLVSEDYARTFVPLADLPMGSVYRSLLVGPDGKETVAAGRRFDTAANKLVPIYGFSHDGGKTWQDRDTRAERTPLGYLPSDPRVVFMREEVPERALDPHDTLWRSSDGGETFSQVGGEWPVLSAFAATPSGDRVWLGARDGGLFVSLDGGASFTRVLPDTVAGVDCLEYRQDVLWACAEMAPLTDGVWSSRDLGQTFEPRLTFEEVRTPVECEDMEICERAFADWSHDLVYGWDSTVGGLAPAPDAGAVPSDASGDTLPEGGAPARDAGGPARAPALERSSSDGCALARSAGHGGLGLALSLLLARRRRARC